MKLKRESIQNCGFSRFNKPKRVIFLSNTFITAIELIVAFFACSGAVYLFKDLWHMIGRKKNKTHAVLYVSLCNDEDTAIETLTHIASFYNNSNAREYISKIIATSVPKNFFDEEEDFKKALRIPLVFSQKK